MVVQVETVEIIRTISSERLKVTVPLILLSAVVRSQSEDVEWEKIDEKDNLMEANPWFRCARPLAELVERMAAEHNGE
jgi:hypothetical protein